MSTELRKTEASWLVAPCDMTGLTAEALSWLAGQRRPGVWAVMPKDRKQGVSQPLLAVYDMRIRPRLESLLEADRPRLRMLAGTPRVLSPRIPDQHAGAWRDVDVPGAGRPSRGPIRE
ncbi:MAG: NTP transferase domain-containing protein [Pirellulaceae bacterium]